MENNNVLELLDMLYSMVNEAFKVPLGPEKCIIDRTKALDLIEEIRGQFPSELSEAQRLVTARSEFISGAKREADVIRQNAEDRANQLIDEQEIVRAAKAKANATIAAAESKSAELRRVANEYADDVLRRTEDAVSEAFREIHSSRQSFRSAAAGSLPRIEGDIAE